MLAEVAAHRLVEPRMRAFVQQVEVVARQERYGSLAADGGRLWPSGAGSGHDFGCETLHRLLAAGHAAGRYDIQQQVRTPASENRATCSRIRAGLPLSDFAGSVIPSKLR